VFFFLFVFGGAGIFATWQENKEGAKGLERVFLGGGNMGQTGHIMRKGKAY